MADGPTPEPRFMQMAIAKGSEGILAGQHPYAATIVRDGEVVACEHNIVMGSTDSTAHAEVNAIRRACLALNSVDLNGCQIYCTCEPCVMCFGACYWANINTIYYGAGIDDKFALGLKDYGIGAGELGKRPSAAIQVVKGVLRQECVQLFHQYLQAGRST